MDTNCENGPVNCSMNSTSADESTLYYSMNNSGIAVDLENTIGEEEALISVEIPDFSPSTMLPDPLAVCDKFLQKTALTSSTPNRLPFPPAHDTVPSSEGDEKTAAADESKDDTLKEETEKREESIKDTSGKDFVSLKQILDDKPQEPLEPEEKVEAEVVEIVEIKEYNIVRVTEDLTKVVIEEESSEEEDNAVPETKKEEPIQELPAEICQESVKQETPAKKIEKVEEQKEIPVTEKDKELPDKEENKENIKDNSEKKQRRRSKIAILANPPAKEPKATGKQSLIRRSILKTDVKSPAKPTKTAQFHLTKRSSLLPKNLPAAHKRQTIGAVAKFSAPAPPLAKPKPTAARVDPPPPPPALKKRQTLAPATATASGSRARSPKGILSTKNPTKMNKSPKFLHPKDVKIPPARDFECKICKKKCRTALVLDIHQRTHKETPKAANVCKYCDRRFEIKQGLENHIQKYCSKIPVGEKRRLLQEEAKANALTPRTKRWIKTGGSSGPDEANTSSASSSSDLMSMLRHSPGSSKRRSVAFAGISATPNRTIKCFQCHKEFVDVFEFHDHIAQHVTN